MPVNPGASAGLGGENDPQPSGSQKKRGAGPQPPGAAARPPVEYALPSTSGVGSITWLPATGMAVQNQARLAAQARELAAAADQLYLSAKFREALDKYRQATALRPDEAEYHYKVGCAAWKSDDLPSVEREFLEALRLNPNHAAAHEGLSQWYLHTDRIEPALLHSAKAVELDASNVENIISRAMILASDGQEQAAWSMIEPLLASYPAMGRLALVYARAAPKLGREQDAWDYLKRTLDSGKLLAGEGPRLHFAAASLLDRLRRYDEAFEQARLANESSGRSHDPEDHASRVTRRIKYYTPHRLECLPRGTHGNRRPLFIVGMPRSGTSLIEQILASHPAVFGGGELQELNRIARATHNADWTHGLPYPECFDALSLRRTNRMAAEYLAVIERLNSTATYVTDKMPLNFMYLGMVQVLFPDSRVIHCLRDPLDTCLSCYMTDFASGNEFSYDLRHLGAFYRQYEHLMAHWKSVLNLPILDVRYEDVVLDLESQVRRLLEFLELPWDERCLRFYQTRRSVPTASREQVRRPIYASSIGRWKNYEKHLSPLIAAMSSAQ